MEQSMVNIWLKALGAEHVRTNDNFFDLGGSSLIAVDLFSKIYEVFGQKLPLSTLYEAPTVEQLVSMLHQKERSTPWSSLVSIQPTGSKPPFFCVHPEGGNVLCYYDLARHLGPDQPFYGLQAEVLNEERISECRIDDLAAHYNKCIRAVQSEGPYLLGGWCLGGLIAFEMAQQLQEQGEKVALLAMIQTRHREYFKYLPNITVFHRLIYRLIDRIDYEMSNFLAQEPKAKLPHIVQRAQRIRVIVQAKMEKVIQALLAKLHLSIPHSMTYTLEALAEVHNKAYFDYEPHPYYGRVAIFGATKQPRGIQPDPTLGWGGLIKDELETYEVTAYHKTIVQEPQVQVLVKLLKACLDGSQQCEKGLVDERVAPEGLHRVR
jgi:thioesterase domain-containing protein/acyl carrier protein